jgi:hypothetical protein
MPLFPLWPIQRVGQSDLAAWYLVATARKPGHEGGPRRTNVKTREFLSVNSPVTGNGEDFMVEELVPTSRLVKVAREGWAGVRLYNLAAQGALPPKDQFKRVPASLLLAISNARSDEIARLTTPVRRRTPISKAAPAVALQFVESRVRSLLGASTSSCLGGQPPSITPP